MSTIQTPMLLPTGSLLTCPALPCHIMHAISVQIAICLLLPHCILSCTRKDGCFSGRMFGGAEGEQPTAWQSIARGGVEVTQMALQSWTALS